MKRLDVQGIPNQPLPCNYLTVCGCAQIILNLLIAFKAQNIVNIIIIGFVQFIYCLLLAFICFTSTNIFASSSRDHWSHITRVWSRNGPIQWALDHSQMSYGVSRTNGHPASIRFLCTDTFDSFVENHWTHFCQE